MSEQNETGTAGRDRDSFSKIHEEYNRMSAFVAGLPLETWVHYGNIYGGERGKEYMESLKAWIETELGVEDCELQSKEFPLINNMVVYVDLRGLKTSL